MKKQGCIELSILCKIQPYPTKSMKYPRPKSAAKPVFMRAAEIIIPKSPKNRYCIGSDLDKRGLNHQKGQRI
jgi:hypothetical protein